MENNKPTFPMRINQYLAQHNYSATRRTADMLIKKKAVFINGRLAVLGDKVGASDAVSVRQTEKRTSLMGKRRPR